MPPAAQQQATTSNNKQQQATTSNNKQQQATTSNNKQQQATTIGHDVSTGLGSHGFSISSPFGDCKSVAFPCRGADGCDRPWSFPGDASGAPCCALAVKLLPFRPA